MQKEGGPALLSYPDAHDERLQEEDVITEAVLAAREQGRARSGDPRPVPGTRKSRHRKEELFRKMEITRERPHDKGGKKDPHKRDTIRGKEEVSTNTSLEDNQF